MAGYGSPATPFRKVAWEGKHAYICNFRFLYGMFTKIPDIGQADVEFAIPKEKMEGTYRLFVFGSSAAFGWGHSASFAQMLHLMLLERYPGVRFEMFNLANGGLNSNIMRPLAQVCTELNPDAFLIYMGNNEVHGPYGLISEFHSRRGRPPSPRSIRLHQTLRRFRLGQLLQQLAQTSPLGRSGVYSAPPLHPGDPRVNDVWRNFDYNLRDMYRSAQKTDARVFVSTLGANLRHWPPQRNLYWDSPSPEEAARLETFIDAGMGAEAQGLWENALTYYASASEITQESPYLMFRKAVCLWELEDFDAARTQYEEALEWDSFVWVRAKQAFNETIRNSVPGTKGNVTLVDGQNALANAAEEGVPGNTLFADGCHFRPRGMYVLAQAFFDDLAPTLPEWVKAHERPERPLPDLNAMLALLGLPETLQEDTLEQLVAKSREHGMDSAQALQKELDTIRSAPSTIDHARQLALLSGIVESGTEDINLAYKFLACFGRLPGSFDEKKEELVRRLARRYIFDRTFQHECAGILRFRDDNEEALNIYRRLMTLYPEDILAYLRAMELLLDKGDLSAAANVARKARRLGLPSYAIHCLQGMLRLQEGDSAALDHFINALRGHAVSHSFAVEGLRKSISLFPEETRHRADEIRALAMELYALRNDWKLAGVLEALNEDGPAHPPYISMLLEMPEATWVSDKLDTILEQGGDVSAQVDFWKKQTRQHPDSLSAWICLGMSFERGKDWDGARSAFEMAAALSPENAVVLFRRGMLESLRGDLDMGMEFMMSAAHSNSADAAVIAARCSDMAARFSDMADYETAARLYRQALEISPNDLWPQVRLGEMHELTGDNAAAMREYMQVLQKAPESPTSAARLDALFNKVETCANHIMEAYAWWRDLVDSHPHAVIPRLYLAMTAEGTGDFAEARETYLSILNISPKHAVALFRLGALEILDGQMTQGISLLREAIEQEKTLAKDVAARCAQLAEHFDETGEETRAMVLLNLAAELAPDDLWHRVALGGLYERTGDYNSAKIEYKHVLRAAPESPVTAARLNTLFAAQDKDALAWWSELVAMHPETRVPVLYLGRALENNGQLEQAHDRYVSLLDENEEYPPALLYLGALKVRMGHGGEGIKLMRQAVAADELLHHDAAERVADLADRHFQSMEYDLAVDLYRLAMEWVPEDLWHRVNLAEVYENMHDYGAALKEYRFVLHAAPESPLTAQRMHELMSRLGTSTNDMRQEWEAVIEIHPQAEVPRRYLEMCLP